MESATKRFEREVAIVTGATAGIGRAVCLELARQGARVVVVGRHPARIEETLQALRALDGAADPLGVSCDVTRWADMERMAWETLRRFGRIDHLIASAGILRAKDVPPLCTLVKTPPRAWDEVVNVNLKGLFLSNKAVLPAMIEQRSGQILNLSSTSGRKAYAFDAAYCAAKFAAIGLTEALAEEVRTYGVRVQVLLPGAIDTPMWDQNGPIRRPEFALPVERVADAILFMLKLPEDTILQAPMIEPFGKPRRAGWLGEDKTPTAT